MTLTLNPEGDNFLLSLSSMNGEMEMTLFPEFGSKRHDQEARRTKKLYKKYKKRYDYSREKWAALENRIAEEDERYNQKWEEYQINRDAFNEALRQGIEAEYEVSLPDDFDARGLPHPSTLYHFVFLQSGTCWASGLEPSLFHCHPGSGEHVINHFHLSLAPIFLWAIFWPPLERSSLQIESFW